MSDTGYPRSRHRKPADRDSLDGERNEKAEALKRSRTAYIGQLTKKYKEVKREMMNSQDFKDIDVVKGLAQKITNTFDNFERCCTQYLECVKEPEDIEEAEIIFERELQAKNDIQSEIDTWINMRGVNPFSSTIDIPHVDSSDSISQVGSDEGSSASSVTKLRLRAKANQAIAELRIRQLKEDQQLEEKIEELTLQSKLQETINMSRIRRRRVLLQAQHEVEQRNAERRIYETEEPDLDKTFVAKNPFDITTNPRNVYNVSDCAEFTNSNPFSSPVVRASTNPFSAAYTAPPLIQSPANPFTAVTETPHTTLRFEAKLQSTPAAEKWLEMNVATADVASNDVTRPRVLDNDTASKLSSIDESVIGQLMKQQEKITSVMANALMLPKPELLTFDGNPLKYWGFVRNYQQNIEAKTADSGERLNYLLQYCTGKAKEVIKNCVVLDSDEGYEVARKLLHERFGEPYAIATAYIELVTQGPAVRSSDREGLRTFADKLRDCEQTLRAIGYIDDLNNADNLKKIADRFPLHLKAKWLDRARVIRSKGKKPGIEHMSEFLSDNAKAANDPVFGQIMDSKDHTNIKSRQRPKTFQNATRPMKGTTLAIQQTEKKYIENSSNPSIKNQNVSCSLCGLEHFLSSCESFLKKPQTERLQHVREKGLCMNCLKRGHIARNCYLKRVCDRDSCNKKHHVLLHPAQASSANNGTTAREATCNSVKANKDGDYTISSTKKGNVCLPILPVKAYSKESGRSITTYALLDQGSDTTLCERRILDQLQITGEEQTFLLTTINSSNVQQKGLTVNFEVKALHTDESIDLTTVWAVERLNISTESAPKIDEIRKWQHLRDIQITEIDSGKVTILIGNDTPEAFWALDQRRGQRKEPYAVKTLLGWTVLGAVADDHGRQGYNTHFVAAQDDDDLKMQVERFWTRDFGDSLFSHKEALSVDDKRALEIMQESTVKSEGHYQIALPWKNKSSRTLNNRPLAEFRLATLRRRFLKEPGLYEKYKEVINDYLSKGYARRILHNDMDLRKRVWYLPHHPVITPKKVRVVFDCAAKWKGTSLNDLLLQGPDQTNSLVGVLNRFREGYVAMAADIEGMFLQVKVDPDDCDMLRFLWWPEGDIREQPEEYQMLVHLFGATSSPSCANFALRKTADDNRNDFDSDVANIVFRNFYVDDMLKSVDNVKDAKRIASEVSRLLSLGGFHLTKWMSNSVEVLTSIPEAERAKPLRNMDLERLPRERALGVEWDVEVDTIGFKTQVKEKPPTRRGMLSVTSSVYDPLGIAAPFVLLAKLILQDLCKRQLTWDEVMPEDSLVKWRGWLEELPQLADVKIPRCLKSPHLPDVKVYQIHHFADASQSAYGSVSYLRMVSSSGEIYCSFLNGKSRLAPVKAMTIPRLELAAAVVAVQMDKMLTEELDLPLSSSTFWSDSTTVLQFINNTSKRFNTFVANRVAIIRECSSPGQWRYVNTKDNPADYASRGMTAKKMTGEEGEIWLNGPEFLWKDPDYWPEPIVNLPEVNDNPEVRREKQINSISSKSEHLSTLKRFYEHYSSWYRLKKAVAWMIRFKSFIIAKYGRKDEIHQVPTEAITVKELQDAELSIIRDVQGTSFANEVRILSKPITNQRKGNLPKSSCINKLNPKLREGVLVVGGRLEHALIPEAAKHPPILPKDHAVGKLIISEYHQLSGHVGKEHLISMVRQKYWIVGVRSQTRRILRNCFHCLRIKSKPLVQQMANLPADRLTPDEPPFTFVGTDYFGPFLVKRGRGTEKRYGCVFTCLTSRAVHIEIAHSLDVDSFLNALVRFMNRRGRPKEIRSDNGTNYRGGEREMREALEKWNAQKIEEFLKQREIVWKFNPPAASSMGGVWERIIRSIRYVLKSLLREQVTTDEVLTTLMTQVESILNSRPLTTCSDDPDDDVPLTPNHILLMRSNACMPLGVFSPSDGYVRRRWRQCQYLANLFWRRWIKEYLPTLQVRQKWSNTLRNLSPGDVVLVVDETVKRGQWPMARVLEVFKARDGLVRSAKVKTPTSELMRPIHKLCLLEGAT